SKIPRPVSSQLFQRWYFNVSNGGLWASAHSSTAMQYNSTLPISFTCASNKACSPSSGLAKRISCGIVFATFTNSFQRRFAVALASEGEELEGEEAPAMPACRCWFAGDPLLAGTAGTACTLPSVAFFTAITVRAGF